MAQVWYPAEPGARGELAKITPRPDLISTYLNGTAEPLLRDVGASPYPEVTVTSRNTERLADGRPGR